MSSQGIVGSGSQATPDMLCYNKGCGQRFNPANNSADSCFFHPGYPIFHDALKGWSCCRKRTTDFSEFLAIKGCTKGLHSNEKPAEPFRPEICGTKKNTDSKHCQEMIVQGPKSAEKMQKERPSAQEPMMPFVLKVSRTLEQELEKLRLGPKNESGQKAETETMTIGTRCKHSGCKEIYNGPDSDAGTCIFHPGVPVFHEGMKFWSCCCIKTSDFNEFLDQRGCSTGKHLWVQIAGKQAVSCRYDWHQTSSVVVITIYAKTAIPENSQILANRTGLDIQISFQGSCEFKKQLELWGVVDVEKSFVNLLPTKVEITLKKSDPVTWARLELNISQSLPEDEPQKTPEEPHYREEESDDDLSWSEDEEFSE
ncbi:cysteine and histidine-rich domain-containing protein 1 [Bombina bombina]|uniref:cysteine and histidine-rich domain-containing protein 1 n=1 Tax=Bombina bombina TaxID=8345 RepID=UPI00235A47AB|nr:cysteine and histidine-rich domain-containing protein 1 [Bombina bombina]